jgi:hypothetical protein
MKVLNCANCGANLKFNSGDPVTICGFCDSVNILENIKHKIEQPLSSSNDGPPNFIEDLKPRILLPQLSYRAKFRQGEYIGILGKFLISNTEIFFKPGKFNWGDLSDKYMKIVNINNMSIKKLGLATQLTITDNNGKEMRIVHSFLEFTNIKLDEVVNEINKRKNNLV